MRAGQADKILVNSEYTSEVFRKTFSGLYRTPRCIYPGVDVSLYENKGLLGALQGITSYVAHPPSSFRDVLLTR